MKTWIILSLLMASSVFGSDKLGVIQATTQRHGYAETSTVEVSLISGDGSQKSHVKIELQGRLTNSKGNASVLKNRDSTIVGFNIRQGVGIYGMSLVAIRKNGSLSVIRNLEEVIGKQMKQIDIALNPQSLLLDKINGNSLRFKYTGEEVSPNYFDVYASVVDGNIEVDRERLKGSIPREDKK